jgi:hypothetical protein
MKLLHLQSYISSDIRKCNKCGYETSNNDFSAHEWTTSLKSFNSFKNHPMITQCDSDLGLVLGVQDE